MITRNMQSRKANAPYISTTHRLLFKTRAGSSSSQPLLPWAAAPSSNPQVLSRSFGHEPDVALAPYIDLCNHRQGSPQPGAFTRDAPEGGAEQGEQEEEVYAFVESSFGGRPLALAAGDEVYISYVASNAAAKQAFLNLGFVPPELLRPRAFSSNSRGA